MAVGVDDRRVAVIVLGFLRRRDRLVHVLDAHYRQERHHLFLLDERMSPVRLGKKQLRSMRQIDSRRLREPFT